MEVAASEIPPTARPGVVVLGSDFKALGVVRGLGRRGIPCVVIDDFPRSAWFSRFVTRRFRWSGAMWGEAFVDFLLRLGREHHFEGWVLLPTQDEVVELVARNQESLSGVYRLVTQDWETIRWAHDKRLAYQVAEELGIAYPRTWYPTSVNDLAQLEISVPAIIKPAVSIGLQYAIGRKVLPARTRAELIGQYRFAARLIDPELLMVQEVIPGDGRTQYSAAVFAKAGTVLAGMTARRTRQYPLDFGLSSSFVEAIEVPGLLDAARKLVHRLRLSGLVEVEFKHDDRDGRDKLLDINLRAWGWHTLCLACGLDFPYMQFREALGQSPEHVDPRYGYRWRRLITDIPAALQEMRERGLSPASYLRSLFGKTVPSVLDVRDPLPALGDLLIVLSRSFKTGSRGRAPIASKREAVGVAGLLR
jgi:predicted ATP-grasp superfamily ATP-dependent carboligase